MSPQELARDVLSVIGIEVIETRTVVLTDGNSVGPRVFTHVIQPSQLTYAVDQFRLATGESVDADELESSLPWLEGEDA